MESSTSPQQGAMSASNSFIQSSSNSPLPLDESALPQHHTPLHLRALEQLLRINAILSFFVYPTTIIILGLHTSMNDPDSLFWAWAAYIVLPAAITFLTLIYLHAYILRHPSYIPRIRTVVLIASWSTFRLLPLTMACQMIKESLPAGSVREGAHWSIALGPLALVLLELGSYPRWLEAMVARDKAEGREPTTMWGKTEKRTGKPIEEEEGLLENREAKDYRVDELPIDLQLVHMFLLSNSYLSLGVWLIELPFILGPPSWRRLPSSLYLSLILLMGAPAIFNLIAQAYVHIAHPLHNLLVPRLVKECGSRSGRIVTFFVAGFLLVVDDGIQVVLVICVAVSLGYLLGGAEYSSYVSWEARAKAEREAEDAKLAEVTAVTEMTAVAVVHPPQKALLVE